ncbi:MAG TPA: lytic transglycosylase domain-containing protein [Phenylobacterium sp.]|nr:lytic transglycosylase domain-containing protein [Phenylobacterium sp.]
MQHRKRLHIAALALVFASLSARALAAGPQVLSPDDAQHYALAFDAVDRGDYVDAALQTIEISDPTLTGYVTYRQLMHPTAHKSNYDELSGWLGRYSDLPMAEQIYSLAGRRKPVEAPPVSAPALTGVDWTKIELVPPGTGGPFDLDNARIARLAFYSGDSKRALELAKATGDRWIAGMAAYRLKKYDAAESYLADLAKDSSEDIWVRAGGAFWAARAAVAQIGKDPGGKDKAANERASTYLRQAAGAPQTFYGMIAERQVALGELGDPLPLIQGPAGPRSGPMIKASYSPRPDVDLAGLVRDDPRAHRAAALIQIGRTAEAAQELRAGLALAKTPQDHERWAALAALINAELAQEPQAAAGAARRRNGEPDYPTPNLRPRKGFTINKALVYAIVRQESRFNPGVVSPAGAVGLMQLMPDTAAHATGNSRFRDDASPLFDPSTNLTVGQDYVTWLMNQGVGYDILRTVAAYNGGPGTLQKTAQMLGDDDESLMVIECMPAPETRDYVEKVMAAYWTYRKKFGQDVKTLDALATGQKYVDARWDDEPAPVAEPVPARAKGHGRKSSRHNRSRA